MKRDNRALGLLIEFGATRRLLLGGVIAPYSANVGSILEYGTVIWAGAARSHLETGTYSAQVFVLPYGH